MNQIAFPSLTALKIDSWMLVPFLGASRSDCLSSPAWEIVQERHSSPFALIEKELQEGNRTVKQSTFFFA